MTQPALNGFVQVRKMPLSMPCADAFFTSPWSSDLGTGAGLTGEDRDPAHGDSLKLSGNLRIHGATRVLLTDLSADGLTKMPLAAENNKVDQSKLSPDEDAELRLLHGLKSFGAVARSVGARYESLRARDRRKIIRDPDDTAVVQPVEKALWTTQPATPVIPAENPSGEFEPAASDEPRRRPVIPGPQRSDTREVLAGETPERRRFFR